MAEFESKNISKQGIQIIQDSQARKDETKIDLGILAMKQELLGWANAFIKESEEWRKSSWEKKWNVYRRDADGTYDPQLKSAKQDWQSTVHMPIIPAHRETIQSSIYRTLIGPRPMMEMKARGTIDEENDQSLNIRDLILREMEKVTPNTLGFEVEFNKVLDDCTTFGSGFCRIRHEVKTEPRLRRTPEVERVQLDDANKLFKQLDGKGIPDRFSNRVEDVETFRGVVYEYLDIWNIYPDPDSTDIRGSTIGYKFWPSVGDIKKLTDLGPNQGGYFQEAFDNIDKEPSRGRNEEKSEGDQERDGDRSVSEFEISRTDYAKKVPSWEIFARLPRKWVMMGKALGGDPEELIPARVIFHERAVMAVEVNEAYDGEPQIYQMKYMPVNGQFYGRGIPEMLSGLQSVINETVNQRIDNVSLVLNKMYAVISEAIISRGDLVNRPGGFIRLKSGKVPNATAENAVAPINTPDISRSAYADVQELERYAQERTSANRVTLGTQGQVRDANKTLGGLELARQAAGEKFGYIGQLIEFSHLREVFRAYWRTIYAKITPDEITRALGEERSETFQLLTPEEVEDYRYTPQGIFTMENKALRQARLGDMLQRFEQDQFVDREQMFDLMAKAADEDPETLKLSPEDMKVKMGAEADLQDADRSSAAGFGAIQGGNIPQDEGTASGLPNG